MKVEVPFKTTTKFTKELIKTTNIQGLKEKKSKIQLKLTVE